jgi:hypothetical protein
MPTTLTLQPTGQVLTVPTRWADVTLAQFVDLEAPVNGELRSKAEMLLGLQAEGLGELDADYVPYIANLIEFVNEPEDVYELHPTVGLPEVGSLPYGTLLMAQQRFAENPEAPWLRSAAYLLALYRVQMTFGKYSAAKVAECEAALLASPCVEVLPDAQYFFLSYKKWWRATPQTPKTKPTQTMTKSKPGPKSLATPTGKLLAWMRRLRATS